MILLKVLLAPFVLVVLLGASHVFWEIWHRKSFLRAKLLDEPTLRRLVALANDPNRPSGNYASRFSSLTILGAGPSAAIDMYALLESDRRSIGFVRTIASSGIITLGLIAFLTYSWIGLGVATIVFVAQRFLPLSSSGQNNAFGHVVRITDVLYKWHHTDPSGLVQWLNTVPGIQPAYRILKSEVLDREASYELESKIGAAVEDRSRSNSPVVEGSKALSNTKANQAAEGRYVSAEPKSSTTTLIRVLLVDDIPSTLDNLQKLVSFEPDIEVVGTAANGKEAIEQAKRLAPDIVLMDICMPIMDGVQATELLSEEMPESRIIAMTVQTDLLQRAILRGARVGLGKPFSGDALIATIHRVMEDRSSGRIDQPNPSPTRSPEGQSTVAGIRPIGNILIVEDNPISQRLAKYLLEKRGFEVRSAVSGAECQAALSNEPPDAVLLDTWPGEDGIELLRRIRADGRTAGLFIVAFTVHAMPGDREKLLALGFDGYIAQPVDPDRFADQVVSYLQERERKTAA